MRSPQVNRVAILFLATSSVALASPQSPAPHFDPQAFFDGKTEGVGQLKIMFRKMRVTSVHGVGRLDHDGAMVLDQIVEQQGEPVKHRQWRLYEKTPDRFSGTLSDASGPVTGEVTGNLLHLSYPMKGGVYAEQWLRLSPNGQRAQNHMVIKKFGITVATLEETIQRTPDL